MSSDFEFELQNDMGQSLSLEKIPQDRTKTILKLSTYDYESAGIYLTRDEATHLSNALVLFLKGLPND